MLGYRRHLSQEERQALRRQRIERVAEARREGKSLRAIAEEEGVAEVQIRRDLEEAKAIAPGGAISPPDGRVERQGGGTYPARRDPEKIKEQAEKRAEERVRALEEAPSTPDLPEWSLIEGDCLEVLPTVASGSVRLVFCDPPYNIGVDYGDGGESGLSGWPRLAGRARACGRSRRRRG